MALAVAVASVASVSAETIFDMIPSPYPGSFPSLGYQATQTHEFGDHIMFGGVERDLDNVLVSLTSWACENDYDPDGGGGWTPKRLGTEACVTTPGSGFMHPITLNIYEVDNSGVNPAVGPLIISKTGMYFIPFRPSWDSAHCPDPSTDVPFGGTWFDPVLGFCVHGYASNITFDFSADGIILPEEVVYGVAYNTQTWGASPIGAAGPYNSLNFSVDPNNAPSIGTDVEDDTVFWDTSTAGNYCDGGSGGVHVFRRDAACWAPFVPVVQFNTPASGACCTDGPGISSDCIIARQDDCEAERGEYQGDGSRCSNDPFECIALAVTMESMSAELDRGGVRLTWTTATETDTVGFRVLRETPGPDKARVGVSSLIPAAGNGFTGATYEFLDNSKQANPAAVYYIEDLDLYGRVTTHGPIEVRRTGKGPVTHE